MIYQIFLKLLEHLQNYLFIYQNKKKYIKISRETVPLSFDPNIAGSLSPAIESFHLQS
jgi:hypothetical protein